MPIPVELLELRGRLEEVGMVVVEEPEHLVVRLPYLCSVRIFADNGRLRFAPYLGLQPRTRATLIKLVGFGAVALLSTRLGESYAVGALVAGVLFGVYDIFRVMLTENVITRASLIYSQMRHGAASVGAAAIGAQRASALNAGNAAPRPSDSASELPRASVESIIKRR
jgi:hypothetical protein